MTNTALADQIFTFKDQMLENLLHYNELILESYDSETGAFGEGLWNCTDQNVLFPLAAAYSYEHDDNPSYKDAELLEKIMHGGDKLIEEMDEEGRWVFKKKDGSTWGDIRMPWTYSRWIRAYWLIKDDMPQERRSRWEKALRLGYGLIAENNLTKPHNIPAHHAMGLYFAGVALDEPEWRQQAVDFLHKVADVQREGGYWTEGKGPVVVYNFVYVEALGIYFAMTGDDYVLPALKRASVFHREFTYPHGLNVSVVDGRNPHSPYMSVPSGAFTHTPEGRAYVRRQWEIYGMDRLGSDYSANALLFGTEGPAAESEESKSFVLVDDGKPSAMTVREGPWLAAFSAYTEEPVNYRWHMDRQNFVGVFHEDAGVLVGGGNTKMQPRWSTFTVGDISLVEPPAGETEPVFAVPEGLMITPSEATLARGDRPGLDLVYGEARCSVRFETMGDREALLTYSADAPGDAPVQAHVTMPPQSERKEEGKPFVVDGVLRTESGEEYAVDKASAFEISASDAGGAVYFRGCRYELPEDAVVRWPVKAFDPYVKDGVSKPLKWRLAASFPIPADGTPREVRLTIPE